MKTYPNGVGFFFFEFDQNQRTLDEEDFIQFYTGSNDQFADDNPPPEIYELLRKLLEPVFGDRLDIGAAESLHQVFCNPKQHQAVIKKVRETLIGAGWKEGKTSS